MRHVYLTVCRENCYLVYEVPRRIKLVYWEHGMSFPFVKKNVRVDQCPRIVEHLSRQARMEMNGQAGASSAREDRLQARRSLPLGPHTGTLAVLIAALLVEGGEWVRAVSKAEACLHEIFRLIGTPSFLDLFVDFYQELEVTKLWFRSNREDHPHSFRSQVARKRSPLFMQSSLGTLRAEHSPVFKDHLNAFGELLDHLIISCTKPDEEQVFKFLLEVKLLADSVVEFVAWCERAGRKLLVKETEWCQRLQRQLDQNQM